MLTRNDALLIFQSLCLVAHGVECPFEQFVTALRAIGCNFKVTESADRVSVWLDADDAVVALHALEDGMRAVVLHYRDGREPDAFTVDFDPETWDPILASQSSLDAITEGLS